MPNTSARRVAPWSSVPVLVSLVLLFAASAPAFAERVEAPLEILFAPETMLVAGPVIELNPTGRVVIGRGEVLHGKVKPPDKIDIRIPMHTLHDLKVGEHVIVGYSLFVPDPRRPVAMVPNPDGATAIVSIGLDPAVFRDTKATRDILKEGGEEEARESRGLRKRLLAALAGDDPALQDLAAGEIALEAEIAERLGRAGRAAVDRAIRDPAVATAARSALLGAAATNPERFGGIWQSAAENIVTTTPVGGYPDEASDPAPLILLALEVLDQHQVKVPPAAIERWVWSADPPLVERACLILRREDPALERSTIVKALADQKLPDATRRFLDGHLRRLDRINAKTRAQGDGSG